ncbi:MAG: hypothetical protein WCL14_13475 [Bacteroidota bacterium]
MKTRIAIILILVLFIGKTVVSQNKDSIVFSKENIAIKLHEQTDKKFIIISGTMKDSANSVSIPFGNILAYENEVNLGRTTSDYDGNFIIKIDTSLIKGEIFDLKAVFVGYYNLPITGIPKMNKDYFLDLKLKANKAMRVFIK